MTSTLAIKNAFTVFECRSSSGSLPTSVFGEPIINVPPDMGKNTGSESMMFGLGSGNSDHPHTSQNVAKSTSGVVQSGQYFGFFISV